MFSERKDTDRHPVFDDQLHQVFLYGIEEVLTRLLHQRHHQLQDLCHVTNHHEVILRLKCQYRNRKLLASASLSFRRLVMTKYNALQLEKHKK